jgi:hypothetical protein
MRPIAIAFTAAMALCWAAEVLGFAAMICAAPILRAADPQPKGPGETAKMDAPMAYREAGSGIVIYVESDRRHVAALDSTGKLLWHRDVVNEDAEKIKNHKRIEPVISRVGIPLAWELKLMASNGKPGPFAGISFYNGSTGVIDLRSGELAGMRSD